MEDGRWRKTRLRHPPSSIFYPRFFGRSTVPPFDEARAAPVAEAGQVEFRVGELHPELQHRDQLGVVPEHDRVALEVQGLEAFEELVLEDVVLRGVDEEEVGGFEQVALAGQLGWIGE